MHLLNKLPVLDVEQLKDLGSKDHGEFDTHLPMTEDSL